MNPFLLLGLCAALSLTACVKENSMETETKPGYGSDGLPYADEPPKEIKINPNRKQHYQMVVKIKDAPLVFQVVSGSEQYQAMNCRYTTSRFAGSTINPYYVEPLKYIKIDDTTYVTDFYTDTPLNEDYYGQGICQWQFQGANVRLIPSNLNPKETRLISDIHINDLEKLSPENPEMKKLLHYEKKDYPIATDLNFENGWSDRGLESWGQDINQFKPENLFTVELTIRRIEK